MSLAINHIHSAHHVFGALNGGQSELYVLGESLSSIEAALSEQSALLESLQKNPDKSLIIEALNEASRQTQKLQKLLSFRQKSPEGSNKELAALNELLGVAYYVQGRAFRFLGQQSAAINCLELSKAYYTAADKTRAKLNQFFSNAREEAQLQDLWGLSCLELARLRKNPTDLSDSLRAFQNSLKWIHNFSENLLDKASIFTRSITIWELFFDSLLSLLIAKNKVFKKAFEQLPKTSEKVVRNGLAFAGAIGISKLLFWVLYKIISKVASFGVVEAAPNLQSKVDWQSNFLEDVIDSVLPLFISAGEWSDYLRQHAMACVHAAQVYQEAGNPEKVRSNLDRAHKQFEKIIELAKEHPREVDEEILEEALGYLKEQNAN
jgi:hypothetical protein